MCVGGAEQWGNRQQRGALRLPPAQPAPELFTAILSLDPRGDGAIVRYPHRCHDDSPGLMLVSEAPGKERQIVATKRSLCLWFINKNHAMLSFCFLCLLIWNIDPGPLQRPCCRLRQNIVIVLLLSSSSIDLLLWPVLRI